MFYQIANLNRELDRLWRPVSRLQNSESLWSPKVDVREREGHWLLSIDVPGVAREDIKVDVVEDQLVVSGERQYEFEDKAYSERSYGHFERRFNLPEGVELDKIEASHDHGVLNLVIPKAQPPKTTTLAINVTEGKGELFQQLVSTGKKDETKQIN